MASAEENDFFDISNFELQLRERINELQWKSESLEETQKDLIEARRLLYEAQTQLDDERRSTRQLEMQLRTTLEKAKVLEEENIKSQTELARTSMRCEAASIERDALIDQAKTARLENMDLRIKLQERERSLANTKMINQTLEASLAELKSNVTRLHNKIHSNVGKLEREQQQLRKSCEAATKFGQRVLEILKNGDMTRQRDKKTIEELRRRVDELDLSRQRTVRVAAQDSDIRSLHLKMESTLIELRAKLENNSIDDKLSALCAEFRKRESRRGLVTIGSKKTKSDRDEAVLLDE